MEGERDEIVALDYAVFEMSPSQNSYEAFVCSKGITEKLATGPLDQLALHLREVCSLSNNSFKLQVNESPMGSSWFTKLTLARFLHIVNMPEVLKVAKAFENEMYQLEETRKFHLSLYSKAHLDHSGGGIADCSKEVGQMQKIKVESASSDDTKNELLRAMDLRLSALKEELAAAFNRAAGAMCSTKQISDLVSFAQHFGAVDLRSCLSNYLALISKDQPSNLSLGQSTFSHDPRSGFENKIEEICEPVSQLDVVKPATNGISPAKIALAERLSSTESEGSSESSDEDRSFAERSRPVIRSASPRRSASPMRRIQIGRSGSRKSTALTIKSLNYFPSRERTSSNKDADGTNSEDGESDQPPKKPDNAVRRMSVQDAINLFESKKKDQGMDVQKKKVSAEVSVSTNKSVLRRWSAGMSDSFTHSSHENATDAGSQNAYGNLPFEAEEKKSSEVKTESDSHACSSNPVESGQVSASSETERMTSPPTDSPAELVMPKVEEIYDRATASAEWNRQKEAELNQMLVKMMESKPGKYRVTTAAAGVFQDISSEQRGGFHRQYKEKRDAKLQAENARVRAAKEAQLKVMQETLEQSKAKMPSKTGRITGKQDPLIHSQRPRRNSSPPVLPKKEVSKPTGSRKTSSKSSPLPSTRNSWSSGPLPRTAGTPPAKPSPGTISANSAPNRRNPQPTPSPTKPRPKTERPLQQPKGKKGTQTDVKSSLKGHEEKQQKLMLKTSKSVKTKSPSASGDDSCVKSAKPSFYSKVTKKSSVVPLESKPFLRKGTGIGPVLAKTKVSQSDDSSKNSGNFIQDEEIECCTVMAESDGVILEHDLVQTKSDVDVNFEVPLPVGNVIVHETAENSDQSLAAVESGTKKTAEPPVAEIQHDEDMSISSSAWVEVEPQEASASCGNGLSDNSTSPGLAPLAPSSPRVRHSLSQMLQADSCETDIVEWGNAENPPAFVYQKDSPKGLKRLLKFARKSKGDVNMTGWATPSVFSEGEDDLEEPKAASKRSSDTLLRKAALQAKACGQQKTMFSESSDGESKRAADYRGMHDILSAQSSTNGTWLSSEKLRVGSNSATAASTKAARSFFSLSTFRSGKSSDTKLR